MRVTAYLIASLFVLGLTAVAGAQPEDGDEPLDLGLPDDEEAPPEEEPPPEDEAPVRDPKMAKQLADGAAKIVKNGEKLLKKKKVAQANAEFERAIPAYERAFELNPDAKLLVIIGALEERLGRWHAAHTRYARAMAETELPLDDKTRAKAQAGMDNSSMYLGIVNLVIAPEGAIITLEGAEIGVSPLAAPLVLDPGEYTLAVTADGFKPLETKLVVDAGSESERSFELEPEPVVERRPPPPPPPEPEPPPPPGPSKLPMIIGAGATLALTIGAVTTGVIALGKHSTFADPNATQAERDDAQASGPTMALLSDVFTGLAVVAAGATVYYYLQVYTPKRNDHDTMGAEEAPHDELSRRARRMPPKVVVAPTVERGGGGLVVAGWF